MASRMLGKAYKNL